MVDESVWSWRIRQHPDVVSSRVGHTGGLVHLQTNRIFELNATGVRVWELLEPTRTLGEVADILLREFDVERSQLKVEIEALIESLRREGLVDDGANG